MKSSRILLSAILAAHLSLPAHAETPAPAPVEDAASTAETAHRAELDALVEEYIDRARSQQPGPVFLAPGRAQYQSRGVGAKIAMLDTGEFNLFLFNLLQRYVQQPENRPYLFSLMTVVRDQVAADLEAAALLRQGPMASMENSILTYWVWASLGAGVATKLLLKRSTTLAAGSQRIHQALAQRGRIYHLAYRAVANPMTLTFGATALWGYYQYLTAPQSYRLDPLELLKVAQANLACHLSYRGLEIQDQFESLSGNAQGLKDAAPTLQKSTSELVSEAKTLRDQFSDLANLHVSGRFFREPLNMMPPAMSWNQFREALNSTEAEVPGTCRQIALDQMIDDLESHLKDLPQEAPEKKVESQP